MKPYKKTHYFPLLSDPNTATLYYNIENNKDIRYLSTCGGGWFWSAENEKSEKEKREFINKLIKIEQ